MASPQGSQPKRPSQLSRSVSKAFRTLGTSEEIQCTKTLIQAFNDNDDEDATGIALHQWLEAYVDEFAKHKPECVRENWIREYALLAMVNVKSNASEALVRRVYGSLRACIKAGEYCSPVIVVALDDMLRIVDSKIVAKETQSLVSLANDLLCLTDPKQCIFTRDTYESHMACLLTLERILTVLYSVECASSKQQVVDFFKDKLRTHLAAIAAKQSYYPFVYNTQLVKYNIDNLIKGGPTATLLSVGRRAFYALCGGLYLFQGIRELAVMRLDFAAMEAGMQKMQHAFNGISNRWVSGLKEVVHAISKSEATNDFTHIMDCYMKHKHPSCWDRLVPNRLKTIKFALVSQLSLFASESSVNDLSDQAFGLLSYLALNDHTKQWRADSHIYECLLDALASIGAKREPLRQDCLQLLHQMENVSIQNHKTVAKDWRGHYSIEQKLDMMCDNEPEIPVPSLYETVRKQLELHLTYTSDLQHKQALIEHYQDQSFAKVSLLLNDLDKRHVADFDFHNVVYELVDAENRVTNNMSSTDGDQMAHNLERSRWVQRTIKLKDIFVKRRQRPSGPAEEVNRVLIIGNPGTGKTSLSKRLCYDWSCGEWGSEFERVYLLQVRQLTGSRLQLEKTLEGAIATLLFDAEHRTTEEQKALHHQIKDELANQTTLLVLDGLDEANGNDAAEAIIGNAVARACNLLVLSRPHNLGDLRSKLDVEIECLGLSDDQLKVYVREVLSTASDKLVQFLRRSPLVWETAKVPINAQILCTLWNSEEGQSLKESKTVNLKSLYSAMTRYAWKRFVDKTGRPIDREEVFSSLETIAFKSINQSKIEIPLDLVMKNAEGSTTDTLLRDSGFLLFHKEGQVFQFAHLSFHEFFAGRFLARSLLGTAKESKKAKKYIAERKYFDTSRVTLLFMTQCYCQEEEDDDVEDCIESLKQLLSIFDEDPIEVVGFQHILLKMRTLDAFLSVCGNCAEDMRSDKELQEVVSSALKALDRWLDRLWRCAGRRGLLKWQHAFCDRIMEELVQMPSLFACLPEFLLTVLKHRKLWYECEDKSKIARLASYAPEERLRIMPSEMQVVSSDASIGRLEEDCFHWFKLFAEAGPESAILILEKLKIACQSQNKGIQGGAVGALPWFLKVLPEQEDLHSLCMNAMNRRHNDGIRAFFMELEKIVFEPNSEAANLVWSLAIESTRDSSKDVRVYGFLSMVREDQTSETSIGKMIAVLQEFASRGVSASSGHERLAVLTAICKLLRRVPANLTLFLPYLAKCCNDSDSNVRYEAMKTVQELSSFLPTAQQRELGEMISSIYCDVENDNVRIAMGAAIYNIGRKVPDFTTDFPDVFSQACNDVDKTVSGLAKARDRMTTLTSLEGVHAINEVFWDQKFEVKELLLYQILAEGLINAETAEVVMEMVAACVHPDDTYVPISFNDTLLSVSRFSRLSTKILRPLLSAADAHSDSTAGTVVHLQPLDRLIEYFWVTADENAVSVLAHKLMVASVTYKAVQGGKSIVSIVERGKKTEQEVSSELVEKLIMLVKAEMHKYYGDLFC